MEIVLSKLKSTIELSDAIPLGQIYREHGVHGFCKFYCYSAADDHLACDESYLLIAEDLTYKMVTLEEIKTQGRYFLLKFFEFDQPEALIPWRKAKLCLRRSQLQREENDLFDFEWSGYQILNEQKSPVAQIVQVVRNPLKQFEVQVLDPQGQLSKETYFVPCIADWIRKINEKEKTVMMILPEGLFENE